jgi:segregation and condensation protein B
VDDAMCLRILEALLFASEDPLSVQRIGEVIGCDKKEATRLARSLGERYDEEGRAVAVEEVAGGFQLRTRPDLAPWVRKLFAARPAKLSRAALETLAIVAYRQPVTRPDIEKIRGVDCGAVLGTLLERRVVKIMGRMDVPGRPIIYGTTREFLELFGLKDLSQLPTLREFAPPAGGHAQPEGEGAEEAAQSEEGGPDEGRGAAETAEEGERAEASEDGGPEDGGLDADGG